MLCPVRLSSRTVCCSSQASSAAHRHVTWCECVSRPALRRFRSKFRNHHIHSYPTVQRGGAYEMRLHANAQLAVVLLTAAVTAERPVKLIIDTDMGGGGCQDCDDVGTLCMANALADNGEVELLAIMLNTMPDASAATISVLQHFYHRDNVPIGAYKRGHNFKVHNYPRFLASRWPSPIKNTSVLPSGVELYRRVLAAQPDASVVISSVGMLDNLADLLRSAPDEHSPLSGPDLLLRKVQRLYVMGGRYPWGTECNFCESVSLEYVISELPRGLRVIFSGQEIGLDIFHGAALSNCTTAESPCLQAYIKYLGGPRRNRFSWDPITTLAAVRGEHAVPGVWDCADCRGRNVIDKGGCENTWVPDRSSNQTYLKLSTDVKKRQAAGAMIDELLCQTPGSADPIAPPAPPLMPIPPRTDEDICLSNFVATSLHRNIVFENDPHVGEWGGVCTCPDGATYNVGDNGDWCESIACRGGKGGKCLKQDGWPGSGRSVDCAPLPTLVLYEQTSGVAFATSTSGLGIFAPDICPNCKRLPTPTPLKGSAFHWQAEVCVESTRIHSTVCFQLAADEAGPSKHACLPSPIAAMDDGKATLFLVGSGSPSGGKLVFDVVRRHPSPLPPVPPTMRAKSPSSHPPPTAPDIAPLPSPLAPRPSQDPTRSRLLAPPLLALPLLAPPLLATALLATPQLDLHAMPAATEAFSGFSRTRLGVCLVLLGLFGCVLSEMLIRGLFWKRTLLQLDQLSYSLISITRRCRGGARMVARLPAQEPVL